ncbi:hypothetical protein [Pseudomonas syringae]|uniref:hypothetical protein n=1 Tax=Pseudomonas syringae TaxID=317 RepID=UPI000A1DD309|nr:hypothetical protein [Pseudomonas syringae]OSN39529.1 hypothetical protein BV342_01240 [Pseudomonas syringae pv. actinidiae]OSR62624.1 hypothetical protein BV325_01662 [Pseudomonas syringae pv. actinidiae]OSR79951.1 hypothetical protein BV328_01648 [Pseudomonas syringae pv. actinidiae]
MENNVSLGFLIQKSESDKAKIAELEERISHQRDDKPYHQADTPTMTESHDYRHELSLRDEQLRREMDLRQESFRAEQAARDKALDEKFSGFLAAQAERDKASDYRFGRIESDLSSIKGDLKTVNSDVHEIRRTLAKYMGGIAVGAAVAGIVIGAAVKFLFN